MPVLMKDVNACTNGTPAVFQFQRQRAYSCYRLSCRLMLSYLALLGYRVRQ